MIIPPQNILPKRIYALHTYSSRRISKSVMAKIRFDVERFFQALGDNTRLRLLNLMGEQEICVCYFVEILEQPQPKISRHLAYLRSAGIVSARREGKWMHYRIVMPPHIGAAQILRQTLDWMKEDKACRRIGRGSRRLAAHREVCVAGRRAVAGIART